MPSGQAQAGTVPTPPFPRERWFRDPVGEPGRAPRERRSLECSEGSASWGGGLPRPRWGPGEGPWLLPSCPRGGTTPVLGLGGSLLGPRDLESVISEQWALQKLKLSLASSAGTGLSEGLEEAES